MDFGFMTMLEYAGQPAPPPMPMPHGQASFQARPAQIGGG
jgi:hypothetical protein